MSADAIAPPEIVVKVPKPSQFEDLDFQEIIPIPHVFLEEGQYYVLTWKSSAVTFGNATKTLVRLRYSKELNLNRVLTWIASPLIGIAFGILLNMNRIWTWIKNVRPKGGKQDEIE